MQNNSKIYIFMCVLEIHYNYDYYKLSDKEID